MQINKQLALMFALLISVILIFHYTDYDIILQDYFYDFVDKRWLIDRNDLTLKLPFYLIPKWIVVTFGIFILGFNIFMHSKYSKSSLKTRKIAEFLLLCIILVPSIVGGSKQLSNMHCPDASIRYGGTKDYYKLLHDAPPTPIGQKPGKCFPAAHSTVGFMLMSLAFIVRRKKFILVLVLTALCGWIMGFYQILKGSHYLSDTIFSMILSYIIILFIYKYHLADKISE